MPQGVHPFARMAADVNAATRALAQAHATTGHRCVICLQSYPCPYRNKRACPLPLVSECPKCRWTARGRP